MGEERGWDENICSKEENEGSMKRKGLGWWRVRGGGTLHFLRRKQPWRGNQPFLHANPLTLAMRCNEMHNLVRCTMLHWQKTLKCLIWFGKVALETLLCLQCLLEQCAKIAVLWKTCYILCGKLELLAIVWKTWYILCGKLATCCVENLVHVVWKTCYIHVVWKTCFIHVVWKG